MCSIQTNIGFPSKGLPLLGPNGRNGRSCTSLSLSCLHASAPLEFQRKKVYPKLVYSAPAYKRCEPVRAFGGKGSSNSQDDVMELLKFVWIAFAAFFLEFLESPNYCSWKSLDF